MVEYGCHPLYMTTRPFEVLIHKKYVVRFNIDYNNYVYFKNRQYL